MGIRRLLILLALGVATTQARTEEDIVYAMRGGLAMLMDVHYPERSNGFGIVFIPGSGWHAPLDYDAAPLKASGFAKTYVPPLTRAGFTVFVINHRAAPRHRHPAAVEDAQRAVRFVRRHAARFGIDRDRIGGVGGSSGGHLIAMLGVLDGGGDPSSADPTERESAKLQAVLVRAGPTDLTTFEGRFSSGSTSSMLGMRLGRRDPPSSPEHRAYWNASPAAYVSPDDPPFLLMHGTADDRVPHTQAEAFAGRLRADGVEAELLIIEGGGHGATFPGAANPPDYLGAMVKFFKTKLSRGAAPSKTPPTAAQEAPGVDRDVVFGMSSGGALLMDVYTPDDPNGYGILHITGSGWHSSVAPGAAQQKASRQVQIFGLPLVEAGYTLFAVNHRTAPLHKHPAQLEDVARAVRFVRHHAGRWGIDPARIGCVGGSSGGHLTLMLGLRPSPAIEKAAVAVDGESAAVQAIVPWAPPTDLVMANGRYGSGTYSSLFGMRLLERDGPASPQYRTYRDASPIHHVSPDDPPTLLIHGDADEVVPIRHSEALADRMRAVGATVKVLTIPGGGHGATFPGKTADAPDYVAATVQWFDRHLRR